MEMRLLGDVVTKLPIPQERVLMRMSDDVHGLTLVGLWFPTKHLVPLEQAIKEKANGN
jgi:hypothetical protein